MTRLIEKITEKLNRTPCLKMVIAFLVGILCGFWSLLFSPLCLLSRYRWLFPYVLLAASAALLVRLHIQPLVSPLQAIAPDALLQIESPPQGEGLMARLFIGADDGSAKVWLEVDPSFIPYMKVGDIVQADVYLETINPAMLGAKSGLYRFYRQGIRQRASVVSDTVRLLKRSEKGFSGVLSKIRRKADRRFDSMSIDTNYIAVLKAVGLGDKSKLNITTKRLYRKAGVAHVMAISGLHVGIIAFLLNLSLFFMNRMLLLRRIRNVLVVALLWAYAFLTGLSPSVCRAVIMFSMFQLVGWGGRYKQGHYNVLCAAALIMLMIDPGLVYDISFQLSFTAVLAILFIVPKAEILLLRHRLWVRYLLLSAVVTLSVMLFSLPFTLYHFGTIALSAFVNNLVVVALLPIVMVGLLVYLLTAGSIAEKLLDLLLEIIHGTLHHSTSLDFLMIRNIDVGVSLSLIMALILFVLAVFIELWWVNHTDKELSILKKNSSLQG